MYVPMPYPAKILELFSEEMRLFTDIPIFLTFLIIIDITKLSQLSFFLNQN